MAHIKSGTCSVPDENTEEIWLTVKLELSTGISVRASRRSIHADNIWLSSRLCVFDFRLSASLCKKRTFTHVCAAYYTLTR